MTKVRYDLEPLIMAMGVLREFNDLDIDKLTFYKAGVEVPVAASVTSEWTFVGLSNTEFVKHILLPEEL